MGRGWDAGIGLDTVLDGAERVTQVERRRSTIPRTGLRKVTNRPQSREPWQFRSGPGERYGDRVW